MTVQVDHHRDPRYTSPMDARNSSQVATLSAWQSEIGQLAIRGTRSFNENLPAPPRTVLPDVCKALGYEFRYAHSAYNFLDGAAKSTVRIEFSPSFRHQAVLVQGPPEDWAGALLWVDGDSVPVPRDSDGNPLCEKYAQWLDDRFMYARFGGLWDHPLTEPVTIDRLGNLRGVLIWDTLRRERRVELPDHRQAWTSPLVELRQDSLRIYADGAAFRDNRADRVLPTAIFTSPRS
jgi:hypothetical protein